MLGHRFHDCLHYILIIFTLLVNVGYPDHIHSYSHISWWASWWASLWINYKFTINSLCRLYYTIYWLYTCFYLLVDSPDISVEICWNPRWSPRSQVPAARESSGTSHCIFCQRCNGAAEARLGFFCGRCCIHIYIYYYVYS